MAGYKHGVIIAAPSSGSGKTTITLGLLRWLKNRGYDVRSAKAGPDFIDPPFHQAASGKPCVNLDAWAMGPEQLKALAFGQNCELLVVEAMMGLFDGAADGNGSAADLAHMLGLNVILVVDASHQSHSIAALASGFIHFDQRINVTGIILNRVKSKRHELMLRNALTSLGISVVGVVYEREDIALPSRHLGLVQAQEHLGLEDFLNIAAEHVGQSCDEVPLFDAFSEVNFDGDYRCRNGMMELQGKHIAVAHDACFSFVYAHLLAEWNAVANKVSFFSPLNNEGPALGAEFVYLPGGYPELFTAGLENADRFKERMACLAEDGVTIYGECGGYMVLGQSITDATGNVFAMCGLLDLETSFQNPERHLGYRNVVAKSEGLINGRFKAHEFHYSSVLSETGEPLFEVWDARGNALGRAGLKRNNVMGSFMHLIAATPSEGNIDP